MLGSLEDKYSNLESSVIIEGDIISSMKNK